MLCSGNDQCTRLADALTFAGRPGKATPSVHPQLVRLRADARAVEVSASSSCLCFLPCVDHRAAERPGRQPGCAGPLGRGVCSRAEGLGPGEAGGAPRAPRAAPQPGCGADARRCGARGWAGGRPASGGVRGVEGGSEARVLPNPRASGERRRGGAVGPGSRPACRPALPAHQAHRGGNVCRGTLFLWCFTGF